MAGPPSAKRAVDLSAKRVVNKCDAQSPLPPAAANSTGDDSGWLSIGAAARSV